MFALFIATGLSVSALPVVAKILSDLGLMRRDFGQMILAAGTAMDSIGWLLLAAFSSIAVLGGLHARQLITSMAGLLIFLAVAATVGRWLLDQAYRRVLGGGGGRWGPSPSPCWRRWPEGRSCRPFISRRSWGPLWWGSWPAPHLTSSLRFGISWSR